jgi:hypothetical protein
VNAEAITPAESVRLIELERIIERGKQTFVEVGNALAEIRDSRVYRVSHRTFEDYCKERWGWSRQSAYQFITASEVVANVRLGGQDNSEPASERQARPLAKLPAEQQPAAWEKAVEKAAVEGKPVAARHVEEAVAEVLPPTPKKERLPAYEPSDGLGIWATAKSVLERISPADKDRESALLAARSYIENRIATNK